MKQEYYRVTEDTHLGRMSRTELFVDGHEVMRTETPVLPINPVESADLAHELALAEKPHRDEIAEHKQYIPRHWWNRSPESRTMTRWRKEQCKRLGLWALIASNQRRGELAAQGPEVEAQLFRARKID